MIRLVPKFILRDPAQGILRWHIQTWELPRLEGSRAQIYWAAYIRRQSLQAYITTALSVDDEALFNRHYWTPETEILLRNAEQALNEVLWPMLEARVQSADWINALNLDEDVNDTLVVHRLLHERGLQEQLASLIPKLGQDEGDES